jgi:hypothetical protein
MTQTATEKSYAKDEFDIEASEENTSALVIKSYNPSQ